MSLNFLGLGFSFGSKDAGLGKSIKKFTGGLNRFKDSFDRMADASLEGSPKIEKGFSLIERAVSALDSILTQNKLQTWIASISLAKIQDIAGGLKDITSGVNLTTSLEATMTANAKATKAMAVQMGFAGKEAQQFAGRSAGLAYGMNVSTESAGKAVYAMKTWGKALRAVGIDSDKTAIKVQEVLGIDINDFGNQVTTLQKQFGFTDGELNKLVGSMTLFGQQTGDVKGALENLPDMIKMLEKRANALGRTLDSKTLADYADQTQELAAGFYAVTANTKEAQEQALAVTNALIGADVNIGKMFSGTEDDLSKMTQSLGIVTGNIDETFSLMKSGPAGFVKGMARMVSDMGGFGKLTGEQANFIHKQLTEALGEDAANQMVTFFSKADASTLKAMSDVKGATADLGKLGKQGFSTGLTLQDSFDRMQQGFVMTFRSVARKEARDFVTNTGHEFDRFNKKIKQVVGEGGPLGEIIKKFAEMHQLGALALIPETLRPMAAVFGTMLQEATPLIGALGALGLRFSHLTNPVTLAIVGFGALAWAMHSSEKQALKSSKSLGQANKTLASMEKQQARLQKQGRDSLQLDAAIAAQKGKIAGIEKTVLADAKEKNRKQIGDVTKSIITRVGAFFTALPALFKSVWTTVKDMWPEIGPPILAALKSALAWVTGQAWPALKGFIVGMWDGLVHGNEDQSGNAAVRIGASIGAALRAGFDYVHKMVKDYLTGWWHKVSAIWSDGSLSLTDKIKATMHNSAGLIIGAFAFAKFSPVFKIVSSLTGVIGGGLVKALGMVGSLMTGVVSTGLTLFTEGFGAAFPAVTGVFEVLGGLLGLTAGVAAFVAAIAGVAAAFYFYPEATQKAVNAVGDFLNKAFKWLVDKALDVGFVIAKYIVLGPLLMIATMGPKVRNALIKAFKGIADVVMKVILGALDGIEQWLSKKLPAAAGAIHAVFWTLKKVVVFVFEAIKVAVDVVVAALVFLWDTISAVAKGAWYLLDTFLIKPLTFIAHIISKVVVGAWTVFSTAVSAIWDHVLKPMWGAFTTAIDGIGAAFSAIWSVISPVVDGIVTGIGWVADAFSAVWDTVTGLVSSVGGFFSDVADGIADAVEGKAVPLSNVLDAKILALRTTTEEATRSFHDMFDAWAKNTIIQGQAAQVGTQAVLDVKGKWIDLVATGQRSGEDLVRIAGALSNNFANATLQGVSGLSDSIASSAKDAAATLNSSYLGELNAVMAATDLTQQQRQQKLSDIQTKFGLMQQQFITMSAQTNAQLGVQGDAFLGAAKDRYATFAQGLQKVTTESAAQAGAAVGSLQKELGVTNEQALQSLQSVASIDPKKFAKDLEQIKATYIGFAQVAITQSKMMLDDTGKSLDEFNAKSIAFWIAQKDLALHYAMTSDDLKVLAANIQSMAIGAMAAFSGALSFVLETGIVGGMATAFQKGFAHTQKFLKDETDLFKKFAKAIGTEFQNAWSVALKATSISVAAIETDLASTIGRLRGLAAAMDAKTDVEEKLRHQAQAKDIRSMSDNDRDQELLNATNWPMWYEDYRVQFSMLVAAMSSNAAGGRGGRVAGSGSAAQAALDKGLGTGAARGR